MQLKTLAVAVGFTVALAGTAQAAPITGTALYKGAEFSITLNSVAPGDLYSFTYTADFTNFTGFAIDQYIIGINYKPSSGDVLGISGAPTEDALGTWTYAINDNLNAGSTVCGDATTGNDFFCGSLGSNTSTWNQNPTTPILPTGPIYTWDFTLQLAGVAAGTEDSLVFNAPIRALFARFNANAGQNGMWQNSLASLTTGPDGDTPGGEDGGTIPEPATLALFGLGAALLGTRLRRK